MTDPVGFQLHDVAKHYPTPAGLVRAVDGVSLEVQAGGTLAVTGPSGCGKSTLLGLIGGLEAPTTGRVIVGREEISLLDDSARARLRRDGIALVHQSDNLLSFLTATENVELQLSLCGESNGAARCRDLLAAAGLADVLDNLPEQLSRGQRQRVAVARALIGRPSLILADEPTGSVDPEGAAAIVDLLLSADATLLIVTHDPLVAGRFERTVDMLHGRLAPQHA